MVTEYKPDEPQYLLALDPNEHTDNRYSRYSKQLAPKIDGGSLAGAVDLRPYCSPVEAQGKLSSCSGHALTAAIEYLENKLSMFDGPNNEFLEVSRMFTYYNGRVLSNTVDMDTGAQIKDGIKALATHGVCRESIWPYDPTMRHTPTRRAVR